jgi:DNA invertase Pin-like site-specific DNA recombinase
VSQWEREAIGERTAAAMQHKASCGEFTGGEAPFGWQVVEGRLAPVEAEQAAIAEARRLRAAGVSLRAVAREVDAVGMRSRTGRPFAAVQVQRMTA